CQKDRCLPRAVSGSDHRNRAVDASQGFGRRGCVVDAAPLEVIQPLGRDALVFGAGGDDHAAGMNAVAILKGDDVDSVAAVEALGTAGNRDLCAKLLRLDKRPVGQILAAEPGGEAEVVLDLAAGAGL